MVFRNENPSLRKWKTSRGTKPQERNGFSWKERWSGGTYYSWKPPAKIEGDLFIHFFFGEKKGRRE